MTAAGSLERILAQKGHQPVDEIDLLLARRDQQAGNDLKGTHTALRAVAAAPFARDDGGTNLALTVVVRRRNAHVA